MWKIILWCLLGLIIISAITFGIGYANLGWRKFFKPKHEDISREVFEHTKSYTHEKIQDLSKLYAQYQDAETMQDKETIKNLVQMQFGDFDTVYIDNPILKNFLVNMRGY